MTNNEHINYIINRTLTEIALANTLVNNSNSINEKVDQIFESLAEHLDFFPDFDVNICIRESKARVKEQCKIITDKLDEGEQYGKSK